MQKTTNLKLNKPDYTDVADIADINANMDIIDKHNHNNGADLTNVNAAKLGGKLPNAYALSGNLKPVATSGSYNDLTNKPTSLPANGGNADTANTAGYAWDANKLNGLPFEKFITYAAISSPEDLNNTNFNRAYATFTSLSEVVPNMTDSTHWYIIYFPFFYDSDKGSATQFAFPFSKNKVYMRSSSYGKWSPWTNLSSSSNIYQPKFSVINSSANNSLSFSERDLDTTIQDIYYRILGLNNYTHPTTSGYKHIPSGGSSGQILRWSSSGTAQWANESTYTHPTTSGYKHIPSGGSSGQILRWSSSGTAQWANESTYTHPTTSGYKHIPTGGYDYDLLSYSSSGTAKWVRSGYSCYTSNSYQITENKEYSIALTTAAGYQSEDSRIGGTATVKVYARNLATKRTHVMSFEITTFAEYDIGDGKYENQVVLRENNYNGNPIFKTYNLKSLNTGDFSLVANGSGAIAVGITVNSSLYYTGSFWKPMFYACFQPGDTGQHNWFSGTLLNRRDFARSINYTNSSVTAGSTNLADSDVIMVYS